MKVWEKYYQDGLTAMSSSLTGKEWREKNWIRKWNRFITTGECGSITCRFCPFTRNEWPCKFVASREKVIEELNKEVEE